MFNFREKKRIEESLGKSVEELRNDMMVEKWEQDYTDERTLVVMLAEWKKWSRQSVGNAEKRKVFVEIITELEKELKDVRARISTHPHGRRTVAYNITTNTETDRQAGDRDTVNSKPVENTVRSPQKRVYGIRGQNEPSKVESSVTNSI